MSSEQTTKVAHNIKVRVNGGSRIAVEELLDRAQAMAQAKPDEEYKKTVTEEGELFYGELYLDRQQPVRRFLRALKTSLGLELCAQISKNPTRYLDTGTHAFLLLDKTTFRAGECTLATGANTISIRINVAAFPATKENAIPALKHLFSPDAKF